MLSNSLKTRGVNFAFLFGPPRMVERNEASRVHNAVCDGLKFDDLTFRYGPSEPPAKPSTRGFSILMERQEGHGTFRIVVDHPGAEIPIRLLMEHHWPPSLEEVKQRFDITAKAVLDSLGGTWQRVMAEARIRAQCAVKSRDALKYLTETLLRLPVGGSEVLGSPATFATIGLHVQPRVQTDDALQSPAYEVSIEILRDDPTAVYLELMARWSQVPMGASAIELSSIRPIDREPSEYVEAAYGALGDWVREVSQEEGRRR